MPTISSSIAATLGEASHEATLRLDLANLVSQAGGTVESEVLRGAI